MGKIMNRSFLAPPSEARYAADAPKWKLARVGHGLEPVKSQALSLV